MSISIVRICNKCEKDISDLQSEEGLTVIADLGYNSIADEASLRIDLCNKCLLDIIKSFKIDPLEK